ncbi:MAG: vWA domain-containing protein [Phycisphaerales bacterium]
MNFANPWVLLLLLLPLGLGYFEMRRRGRTVALPFDHATPRRRIVLPALLRGFTLLPALLLALTITVLAGPKQLGPPGQERVLTNIEVCLDVSGSMSSPMGGGMAGGGGDMSRYDAACRAIEEFTRRREGDACGLTIFGIEVVRWVPLTKDLAAIRNSTPFLNPESQPPQLGGTRVGHALRFCGGVLAQQPEGDRLIVLLTDGYSSDLDGGAASGIASELAGNGVVVHGIHVGNEAPPEQLNAVVSPTGGQVYSASNLQTLSGVFEHIDRMHRIRLKPTQREPIDFFSPFALSGLALSFLSMVSLLALRYTPW